jgi:hypothetical protein
MSVLNCVVTQVKNLILRSLYYVRIDGLNSYLQELMTGWNKLCTKLGIPCTESFSLIATLGEPIIIRAWNIAGLPVDSFSVDNGIIVTSARRWPLMIDPQGKPTTEYKMGHKTNETRIMVKSRSNNTFSILNLLFPTLKGILYDLEPYGKWLELYINGQ